MLDRILVVSKDIGFSNRIKNQVLIAFPTSDFGSCKTTRDISMYTLEFRDIVIYNSISNGPVPQHFINDNCGYWINISEKIDDSTQIRSLSDGFSGIISSQENIDKYPHIIRCIQSGEIWFSRHIIAFAIRQYQAHSIRPEEMIEFAITNLELTYREKELTRLLIRGQSNQEIANSLCISIHTVKTHVSRILGKLNVHSRNELNCLLNSKTKESQKNEIWTELIE